MRKNLPVTQKNINYPESTRIVSTTTKKGVITFANEDFEEVAGYQQDELIGQAHNLIRHPDMPQAAFKDLWDTLDQGKPWMGIVKNRAKNGDHYWVDAFVMEEKGHGQEDGYQSVRFKPDQAIVDRAESVYEALNNGKAPFSTWSPVHWSLFAKMMSVVGLALLPLIVMLVMGMGELAGLLGALAVGAGLAAIASSWVVAPYRQAAAKGRQTHDSALAQFIYTGRQDELGAIALGNKFLENKLETALWRVASSARQVEYEADNSADKATETMQQADKQVAELEQLATAMNEMVASISEVSKSAVDTSGSMDTVRDRVSDGRQEVGRTRECMDSLVSSMNSASGKIKDISESSHSISDLVNAIHSIAEQTNLLALNAAIEAARAGEQGRGFAVVADEVRNLANNTATTTEQIQQAIVKIRSDVEDAVAMMEQAESDSNQTVSQSVEAYNALESIYQITQDTSNSVTQIATAAEEQSAVSEEINQNIHHIQEASQTTASNMSNVQEAYMKLHQEVSKLRFVASDFSSGGR